jgi:hypothetical protein
MNQIMHRFSDRGGAFGCIAAEPPWPFRTYSAKGKGCSAEMHYSCMSIDAIGALPRGSFRQSRSTGVMRGERMVQKYLVKLALEGTSRKAP